jgi:hypothetical protein
MDEIELNVKGIKPLKLQVYFTRSWCDMGQKNKYGRAYGSQIVTTCIIRRNGLILGTGVAVCHPDDKNDEAMGQRQAFKSAAIFAGWKLCRNFRTKDHSYDPNTSMARHLYSAWRKALREQAEAEKA